MSKFDDLDDLDEVFGPLRSAAQPAELSRESETIDLMVNAHRTSEGTHMFTSRRAKIATLVAAGVLGFGGMAAASSPGFLGEQPAEPATPIVEEEPDEEPDVEPVEEPAVDEEPAEEPIAERQAVVAQEVIEEQAIEEEVSAEEPVEEEGPRDDPDMDTEFNEGYCEDGNHGKTVSAVARGVFDPEGLYPGDVAVTVTMAAQSSCGKIDDDGEIDEEIDEEVEVEKVEEPEIEESEIEESEVEESEVEKAERKAERPGNSGKGGERAANARSNGNGGGNGHSNGKRGG